jgi:hypothetical protein
MSEIDEGSEGSGENGSRCSGRSGRSARGPLPTVYEEFISLPDPCAIK